MTPQQPNHGSTAPQNGHASSEHALHEGETLTTFARPPHDQQHAPPRQLALAARRAWLVPPPPKTTQIEHVVHVDLGYRSTVFALESRTLHTRLIGFVSHGIPVGHGNLGQNRS